MSRKQKIISPVIVVDIAEKGMVIGKDEQGLAYLMKGAVPGDVVEILHKRNKKGMRVGTIVKILQYSKDRVSPLCIHFADCGGCQWQNLDYEVQLKFKQKMVTDALQRIAKIDHLSKAPILASENIFWYRNKLEFSFSNKRWLTKSEIESQKLIVNQNALGFHSPGSFFKVVDIEKCWLQSEFSNSLRNHIRRVAEQNGWSYYDHQNHNGFLRNLIIRSSELGERMVILSFAEPDKEKINNLMTGINKEFNEITSLLYVINEKRNDSIYDLEIHIFSGNPYLNEKINGVKYRIGPKSFFQTNPSQSSKMLDIIWEFAEPTSEKMIFDLYSGIGFISLYIANFCKMVIAVEENQEAVYYARVNAEINSIDNIMFLTSSVKNVFNESGILGIEPQVIITDPPRSGMDKQVIHEIIRLAPERIVYVSCNPASQARDIYLLSGSYSVERSQALDMFPHTNHIENIVLLLRK